MAAPDAAAGEANLNFFYEFATLDDSPPAGDFVKIRRIAECGPDPHGVNQGRIELHMWSRSEEPVAVKRVKSDFVYINRGREPDDRRNHFPPRASPRRHQEDMLTEIGTYRYLFREGGVPEYILRMHTVFQRGDDIWLVLENATGGDLFNRCLEVHTGEGRDAISQRVRRWMWQLLQAVSYMHGRAVGHRDISLENVLLNGDDVRLMDFGQAVRSHSEAGRELRYFRYFGQAGKDYYRPCNMYVPAAPLEWVAPTGSSGGQVVFYPGNGYFFCEVALPPDAVPGERCTVEPAGYHVRPADVFACAVCAFILSTSLPPWKVAHPSDGTFKWVCRSGIVALLRAWGHELAPEVEDFMARAMNMDASQRPTSDALLEHAWFEPIRREGVEGT